MNTTKLIPYRLCEHVLVKDTNDYFAYINLITGECLPVIKTAHEYILGQRNDVEDGLGEYVNGTVEGLITKGFIEPDLSKITIGQASVCIPKPCWADGIDIDLSAYDEYLNKLCTKPTFDFGNIKDENDLSAYQYLCERNTLRFVMLAYGVKHPLLWLNAGLLMFDISFLTDGRFHTSFSRPMLDAANVPIVGDMHYSLDWDVIDAHLAKGLPVDVIVDVFHMPYKKDTYYQNRHGSHSVVLLEKQGDSYLMLDWYHPDYFYGTITKAELKQARTSENKKEQMSVFSGFPINAAYRLLFPNRKPVEISLMQTVRSNLYNSVKAMLQPGGAIAFVSEIAEKCPEWLGDARHEGYTNAIQSFFFLDLELRFLLLYFDDMVDADLYNTLQPQLLKDKAIKIKDSVEPLRRSLLVAQRRKNPIEEQMYLAQLAHIKQALMEYCETVIMLLKGKG